MKYEFTFGRGQPDAPPTPATPFRILVLADLDARTSRNLVQPLGTRRPTAVDVDNLESFLKRVGAEVRLALPGNGGAPLQLPVSSLDELHPDHLFQTLDLFSTLRDARRRLLDPATAAAAAAEVRGWGVAATTAVVPSPSAKPGTESDADVLGRLMGRAPAPTPTAGAQAADLIRRAITPFVVAAPVGDQPALLAAIDSAATELMRSILRDPAFQALESAWRGIDFLVRNLETSEELVISVCNISRAELAVDLPAGGDVSQSGLFRILVGSTVQSPGADPWSLILGLCDFGPDAEDLRLLETLGALAQAAGAPFLAATGPGLARQALDQPSALAANGPWMNLRRQAAAGYLGLAGPRFLLRSPYGKLTDPVSAFGFEEIVGAPSDGALLWGHPALAVGVLLGRAFTESGWEMSPGLGLELDGLPIHSWKEGGEARLTPCAETWLTDGQAERMLAHGLMPLQSIQGKDAVRLTRVQSLREPAAELAGRWTQASV